jgi:transglutaminase-like putative cysteine protease
VIAATLAVAVPALVPGLRAGWVGTERSSVVGGAGGRSPVVVNPIVDLRRDLTLAEPVEVMRVRTTDPDPDYLRMVALDVFDGTRWRQSRLAAPVTQRVARGLPAPLGLDASVPTTTVRTWVRVRGLDVPWLPLPYPATDVDVRGDWRYDRVTRVVFSTRATTPGLRYVAVSHKVLPSRAALDAAPAPAGGARDLQLPPDLPRVLPELAAELTAGSTTAYRRAVALQDWFRTQFAYDTTVATGNGSDALLGFLQDRRGYCEQFAGTMALMARALGIPARVAVGFTPGVRTADGTWSITTRDAHA